MAYTDKLRVFYGDYTLSVNALQKVGFGQRYSHSYPFLTIDSVTGKDVLRYGGDFDDKPADYEFPISCMNSHKIYGFFGLLFKYSSTSSGFAYYF